MRSGVLNAHLGKRGVFDFGLANSRYLITGAHFVVFLAFWYLSAGRAIIFLEKWGSKEIESAAELRLSRFWYSVIFINSLIGFVFSACISAAFFSITLLGNLETITFGIYLLSLLPIVYTWNFLNLDFRYPRAKKVLKFITGTAAIIIFFITIDICSTTMTVFFHFLLISASVNLTLFSFERSGITFSIISDRLTSEMISLVIFVLLTSVLFGWFHYENIKSYLGGGQLREVEIIVVDQKVKSSLEVMGLKVEPFLKAKLIHENQQEFIIDVEDQIVRSI